MSSISFNSWLTALRGIFLTCLFGGIGRGGAGPFFFFHCPSVDALSGDNGLTTIDGPAADPVILELDGVMAEIEALLVDALQN